MPVRQRLLMIGEPAPWFTARSTNNANFHFDTIEATPITQGRRYAYLPFLYDQVRAKVRQANQHLLGSALKEESTKE